jgi:RsiW-degrading membrane proteinase PrsW (M82 family)
MVAVPFVYVNSIPSNKLYEYRKEKEKVDDEINVTMAMNFYKRSLHNLPYDVEVNIDAIHYYSRWSLIGHLERMSTAYDFIIANNEEHRDFALNMCVVGYLHSGLSFFESHSLDEVKDTTTALYAYSKAMTYESENKKVLAAYYYKKSIKDDRFSEIGIHRLKEMWRNDGNSVEFYNLIYDIDVAKHLGFTEKSHVYYADGEWGWYVWNILYRDFGSAGLMGYLAVFFSILVWFLFLQNLLFIHIRKWKFLILVFVLSTILTGLTYPFSDMMDSFMKFLGFYWTSKEFNYNFIHIGVVEEIVKLIPWVIVYFSFRSKFKRPVHFMMLPIVSALGFAFAENLIYINSSDYERLFIRSTLCISVHIVCSSVIGYLLFMSKSKRLKIHWALALSLGIFIGAIIHGAYDYFVYNHMVFANIILFVLVMHILILMMNNVINVSGIVHKNGQQVIRKNGVIFLIGISVIFLSEYLIIGIDLGSGYAKSLLYYNSAVVALFSVYLFMVFNRITLRPGVVRPFNYDYVFGQFIPSRVGQKIRDEHNDRKLKLFAPKTNQFVGRQMPVEATVMYSITVQGQDHWYLIEFDKNVEVSNCHPKYAVISSKDPALDLFMDKIEVILLMIKDYDYFMANNDYHTKDFYYVGKVFSRPLDVEQEIY